jgi:hypothetical protein
MFNCRHAGTRQDVGMPHLADVGRSAAQDPGWLRTVAGECERAVKELEDCLHDFEAQLLAADRDR